eukprot:2149113-Amphidinium_carterae.1
MLTYGWRLPPVPNIWGRYCDDYMQLAILDNDIEKEEFNSQAVEREFKAAHESVCEAYNENSFLRKAEKAVCDQTESKFWGAEVSSHSGRVSGDLDKLRNLVCITLALLCREFVTPCLVEKMVGYWTHFMLFNRLCL